VYSFEDRMRAVELYIKYDLSAADTIRELGYPSYNMLVRWYREYQETGRLHKSHNRTSLYTQPQIEAAVNYYLEHGRNISRTVRAVGYPSRETLRNWIDELASGERKARVKCGGVVQFSQEQKQEAVVELCAREGPATDIADKLGVSRCSLYKWKRELLGGDANMSKSGKPEFHDDRDELLATVESLKNQIYRKQMELDILNKAAEIIKKDQCIDPRKLANKEKASLIDVLRTSYPLNELLRMMGMPKSSYFYQKESQMCPDKYASLRAEVKKVFTESHSRYGYRRVHAVIKRNGKIISEKVIRRIMKEESLPSLTRKNADIAHTKER